MKVATRGSLEVKKLNSLFEVIFLKQKWKVASTKGSLRIKKTENIAMLRLFF